MADAAGSRAGPVDGGTKGRENCYHCGLPVPPGTTFEVRVEGVDRPMCCHGCQAVAQAIVDAGLTDFYQHRTSNARTSADLIPAQLREFELYDREDLQQDFVRRDGDRVREAALILEGIVCAACVWLNERHVRSLPGVIDFQVNYSTHRASLRWDPERIQLSEVLKSIAAIGYLAHPFDPQRQQALYQDERSRALRRLAVAGFGAMQVMMLAVALYAGGYQGMDSGMRDFLRWASLVVTLPVVIYSGQTFFISAWRDLRRRRLGMDVPVSLAIGLALGASIWSTVSGGREVYFDSVTMFTFFLLAGRFLELGARHQAGRVSEQLVGMLPAMARRIGAAGEELVAVAELRRGDQVRIRPGDNVPADGVVVEGLSSIDESLLSGESTAVAKSPGDRLVGGSVNLESPLLMTVEQVGPDTVLSSIVRLLERAQSERPRIAALAERVAGWFVAGVLLLAAVVAIWWLNTKPADALWVTLSVLVVTCPCALSLATPAAVTTATGALTRLGLLTTRGHALETLARASHMVFDKTGTLTEGRLRLTEVITSRRCDRARALQIAAALESSSEHPAADAIIAAASAVSLPARQIRNVPGQGIEGLVGTMRYRLGNPQFVAAMSAGRSREDFGNATVWLGDEDGPLAGLILEDRIRPQAVDAVAALQDLGLRIVLLSGDHPRVVEAVAGQIGIVKATGGLLPADKLEQVRALQRQGAVVAMVGDGINDGPVLAGAEVSIAMAGGTRVAQAAADMVLFSDNLGALVVGVRVARQTLAVIRQNLVWALGYNALALPLAATGWVRPWMAAIGMSLSSLLVVLNALRLRKAAGDENRVP